jgi:hypothetical protein
LRMSRVGRIEERQEVKSIREDGSHFFGSPRV